MHGDRGNMFIVKLMFALCIGLHVVAIPFIMWGVGL